MIKITIFGVGLIGGSLALCFKGKPGYHIVGHSYRQSSVEKYLSSGVVDEATTSMEDAAKDADFIFLCVPVGNLEEYLLRLNQMKLKPGCIVSDVGSTKESVCKFASSLQWDDVHFIGGHPMAGSEQSGVEAAVAHLYENAFYVLSPLANTPTEAYDKLAALIKLTGANVIQVDPSIHDEIVGAISHLPHVIAAVLVNQVADHNEQNDLYAILAAGGFRDFTRIASCDPIIWRDILLNNRQIMLKLLADWNERIAQFVQLLERSDGAGIEQQFVKSSQFRNSLPERRKGILLSEFDLYVDVADHPGIIGEIATCLGTKEINLKNIQVMESREDVPGILRLSFAGEEAMNEAAKVLQQNGYSVRV